MMGHGGLSKSSWRTASNLYDDTGCMEANEMKLIIATALATALSSFGLARAEGCNIADVIFGKVRIEIIPHNSGGSKWETGIIFGNDTNGGRYSYYKILGQVDQSERDGSRAIKNIDGELCGTLNRDMSVDTEYASCVGTWCKRPISIRQVTPENLAVVANGSIQGTIEGRFPK